MARSVRAVVRSRSGGQAMIESLIGSLLLIPLFLGVWYVGTLQIAHLDIAAGLRETALTVYVRDSVESVESTLGDIVSMKAPASDVLDWQITTGVDSRFASSSVAQTQNQLEALLSPVTAIASEPFDLGPVRPLRLVVTSVIAPAPWSGVAELVPQHHSQQALGVLVGTGESSGREQTLSRTRGLSPAEWFSSLMSAFDPLRSAITLLEPSFENFCPGQIEPDIVPADRLPPSAGDDLRSRSCD